MTAVRQRRRFQLVRGLALLAFVGISPGLAQPEEPEPQTIIVTGIAVQDHRDRLAACLARNCATDEDADATLALAEALFLNGEYGKAREQVRASLRRNRGEARRHPEPVSDLYRADARLSRHLGLDQAALRSTHSILAALCEGLPQQDHRHFTARLEISEMLMSMARIAGARRTLADLARDARAAGREDVAVLAELRSLWFDYIAEPEGSARTRLAELARSTDPQRRMQSTGARLLLSRIHRSEGDTARADALLAEIRQGTSARRRLLFSPPYQLHVQEARLPDDTEISEALRYTASSRLPADFENGWIDVGFWVLPDGRVSGLEILRRGADPGWAEPLLDSIRGRVYSTADQASYRLERYTYTSGYERADATTGSHVRRRSPRARVDYLDLTSYELPTEG